MDASTSRPFNLDFYTSQQTHLLDDLRQRVFRVNGWLLHVTHIARLDTPFTIKLS